MCSNFEKFADLPKNNSSLTLYISDTCGLNKCATNRCPSRTRPRLMKMLNEFNGFVHTENMIGNGDFSSRRLKFDKHTNTEGLTTTSELLNETDRNAEFNSTNDDATSFKASFKISIGTNLDVVEVYFEDMISNERFNIAEQLSDIVEGFHEVKYDHGGDFCKDVKRFDVSKGSEKNYDGFSHIDTETVVLENYRSYEPSIDLEKINVDEEVNEIIAEHQYDYAESLKTVTEVYHEFKENTTKDESKGTLNDSKDETVVDGESEETVKGLPDDTYDDIRTFANDEVLNVLKPFFKSSQKKSEYMNYLYDMDLDDPISYSAPNSNALHLKEILNNIDDTYDWNDADVGKIEYVDNFALPKEGFFMTRPSTILEEKSGQSMTDVSVSISSD